MIVEDHDKLISFWTPHIEQKQASAQTRSDYCRSHNLKLHQMAYWERRLNSAKLKKRPQDQMPQGDHFVKAVIQDQAGAAPRVAAVNSPEPFRLILGTDLAVELSNGTDPLWLAKFVNAMRGMSR